MDPSAFSNIPPGFSGPGSFASPPYGERYGGGLYPPSPARFNDMQMPMPHQMHSRFYHGRYLHDQDDNKSEEKSNTKQE